MTAAAEEAMTPAALAAQWFARRRAGLTPLQAAELAAWLEADPAHRQALRNLHLAWRDVETMRDDPRIMSMRAEALGGRRPSRRTMAGGAIAACLALVVAGTLWGDGLIGGKRFSDQEYRTGTGQRASVTLPDGSVVTLNTDSVLRTRASSDRRLVYLDRGQAYFKVAKNPARPFVVAAAGRTVTALGTAFDVRVDDGRQFKVTLVEGKVRVEAPAPPKPGAAPRMQATEMVAGTQLQASADAKWNLAAADVQRETSWVSGQLVFYAEPLRNVVAELNRYSEKKIVLGEAPYAARPISGAFRTGDVQTFVKGLETYRMARVERETPEAIYLTAP